MVPKYSVCRNQGPGFYTKCTTSVSSFFYGINEMIFLNHPVIVLTFKNIFDRGYEDENSKLTNQTTRIQTQLKPETQDPRLA